MNNMLKIIKAANEELAAIIDNANSIEEVCNVDGLTPNLIEKTITIGQRLVNINSKITFGVNDESITISRFEIFLLMNHIYRSPVNRVSYENEPIKLMLYTQNWHETTKCAFEQLENKDIIVTTDLISSERTLIEVTDKGMKVIKKLEEIERIENEKSGKLRIH